MAVIALSVLLALCLHANAQQSIGMEQKIRLIIGKYGDHPMVNHTNFPDTTNVPFSPVFDKEFLKKVYMLKQRLENLQSAERQVALRDICVKRQYKCVVESVWSYFQDRIAYIDRKAMDEFGFFTEADYLDHLQACFRKAWLSDDDTALHMSCLPKTGYVTSPDHTLYNFTTNPDWVYRDATSLVITFHVKVTQAGISSLTSWVDSVKFFLNHVALDDYPEITAYLEEPYRLINRVD